MIHDPGVRAWHRALLVGSAGLTSVTAWLALWQFGATLHGPVHHHTASGSTVALLFVGAWTVMTIAMMLPTSVPLVATFDAIASERPDRPLLIGLVIAGYLAIWRWSGSWSTARVWRAHVADVRRRRR